MRSVTLSCIYMYATQEHFLQTYCLHSPQKEKWTAKQAIQKIPSTSQRKLVIMVLPAFACDWPWEGSKDVAARREPRMSLLVGTNVRDYLWTSHVSCCGFFFFNSKDAEKTVGICHRTPPAKLSCHLAVRLLNILSENELHS